MFWVRDAFQAQGWILAEAAISRAEALPPLEGEAAFHRKHLIARALNALIDVSMSFGDNEYANEVSTKCEFYAREIGDKTLMARLLSLRCVGFMMVGDIEGVETWSREALEFARETDDAFALGMP